MKTLSAWRKKIAKNHTLKGLALKRIKPAVAGYSIKTTSDPQIFDELCRCFTIHE
jgi:hypothetical protein